MIKTHLTPTDGNISIKVPQDYIGKQVEVLMYKVDELVDIQATKPLTMSAYKGLLSKAEATELQDLVSKSREEWKDSI
jgi:hypothetical protein